MPVRLRVIAALLALLSQCVVVLQVSGQLQWCTSDGGSTGHVELLAFCDGSLESQPLTDQPSLGRPGCDHAVIDPVGLQRRSVELSLASVPACVTLPMVLPSRRAMPAVTRAPPAPASWRGVPRFVPLRV